MDAQRDVEKKASLSLEKQKEFCYITSGKSIRSKTDAPG